MRKLGRKDAAAKLLAKPLFPDPLSYLWANFWAIWEGSTDRITWTDLYAWSSLTKNELRPWESETIMRIDSEFRKSRNQKPQPSDDND